MNSDDDDDGYDDDGYDDGYDDDDDDDDDVRACAAEIHMNISQEPFCVEIYRGNVRGHLRGQRFVRACTVEMHMATSQNVKPRSIPWTHTPDPYRGPIHTRILTQPHMDISQEPLCMEIYRENAKSDGYHLDWTPGLNCYRKNPSVWPHCLGE